MITNHNEYDIAISKLQEQLKIKEEEYAGLRTAIFRIKKEQNVSKEEFADMTIGAAAYAFLSKQNRACSTNEIFYALQNGGVKTKSKQFKANLYTILRSFTKGITRAEKRGTWEIKK